MECRRFLPALIATTVLASLLLPVSGLADEGATPFLDYRTESWFLPQSPSVMGGPAAALFNPAAWAVNDKVGLDTWEILIENDHKRNQYGTSFGRNLGLAINTQACKEAGESFRVFDYTVGLAGGDRRRTFGLSYRWSRGDTDRIPRQQALAAGVISRPNRWLSYGASGVRSMESEARQYILDLGVRPFGRQWLSLFADWTANAGQAFFGDGVWGAGTELR